MRRHVVNIASFSIALLAAPILGASAQLNELQPGAHVRLRAPGIVAGRIDGIVLGRTRDSVTITVPQTMPLQLPLAAITSAEVSRGKSHAAGAVKGLAWGSGIGLAVGLLGQIGYHDCRGSCRDTVSRAEMFVGGVVGGAMIGTGIGAIIGSEHWEALTLPVRVTVFPARRTRLALSISF